MANIKIYIDNKLVDLPTDELNLNLSYSLKSRDGIAINTGSRSEYSFEFPSTHKNDSIFSRFYDVSEQTGSKQIYLSARIEVDGLPFFSGIAQLTSVTITDDLYYWKGETWKVSFYGNNVDWVTQLKDKFLYQYDYGTHTHDYSTIPNSFNYDYFNNYTFKYTLIKWKDWNGGYYVSALECTPALFIKSIVDRIFNDIGYTYQSNFFNTPTFEKLVMPIPLKDKITDPQYNLDYLQVTANDPNITTYNNVGSFLSINTLTNQTVAPLIGINPYNNITSVYTVPYTGFYLLKIFGEYQYNFPVGCAFYFRVNGVNTNIGIFPSYFPPYTSSGEGVVSVNAGDIIDVAVLGLGGSSDTSDVQIFIDISGEASVTNGTTIDFKYFINSQWNSLDFIKGLSHLFNLTFQTDVDNKTIIIEPSNTYIDQSTYPPYVNIEDGFYNGKPLDMTPNLDLSKGGEIFNKSDINQLVKFTYKYDSADPTLEAISEFQDLKLHQARFTFIPNRFQKDEDVIENPFFSTTLCIADTSIKGTNSIQDPIIPIIWSQNYLTNPSSSEANYDIIPRILISENSGTNRNGIIFFEDSPSNIIEYDCPLSYMIDYNNLTGDFVSLSFGNEIVNEYNIVGLLERFYLADFIRLQSGKEVECYIFWDATMVRNLNFRDPIKIHSDNYILREINMFSVTSNLSTKTYLLYDDKGIGKENNQIFSSLIIGKLNN